MRTYDFSPLYRSAIGFDRLAQLFDEAQRAEAVSYTHLTLPTIYSV